MDGPSVNWRFHSDYCEEMKKQGGDVLELGSCGLHIIHGAYRAGIEATGWGTEEFLKGLYYIFKDSPARREDYTTLTGSTDFPFKFCPTRWVENKQVAKRAFEILSPVNSYVKAVQSGKIKPKIKTKSFENVSGKIHDVITKPQLLYVMSLADIVEPFLVICQTDNPMLPFLATDLANMLKKLASRVDSSSMALSGYEITKLNIKVADHTKVDVGFQANQELKRLLHQKKLNDRQVMEFKHEFGKGVVLMFEKLLAKCPLKYPLVRNAVALDPAMIYSDKENCIARFDKLLKYLVDHGKIKGEHCDAIKEEYKKLLYEDSVTNLSAFKEFDSKKERVDIFFQRFVKTDSKLFSVIKIICTLSHGQASVERGFSLMKESARTNMDDETFVSERVVLDHIRSVGGCSNVAITPTMRKEVRAARQRYVFDLDEKKKAKEVDARAAKGRAAEMEISELRRKKSRLDEEIKTLTDSSNEFVVKAGQAHKHRDIKDFITKSLSHRESAEKKQDERTALEKTIIEK